MDYLEMNAAIYCISAKRAISIQGESLMDRIRMIANDMRRQNQQFMSYDTFVEKVVDWTEESIVSEGWSLTEVDGISWFIALYAKAYSIIKPEYSFDQIFKDAFKLYYQKTPFRL